MPNLAEVQEICAIEHPVLRNLRITQCYHELSQQIQSRTGSNANWCTYATWASKQAGQTIRQEDIGSSLEGIFEASPVISAAVEKLILALRTAGARQRGTEIREAIWQALDLPRTLENTSAAVAAGNLKVFAEIGHEFARFNTDLLGEQEFIEEKVNFFCQALRPGEPPDGQASLHKAFRCLAESFHETDPKRRAELLYLSNILIGYHEQTRLQPEILTSLDAPFVDAVQFTQRLLVRLFPRSSAILIQVRTRLAQLLGRPPLLELAVRGLLAVLQLRMHQLITETLMTIRIPGSPRLRLGYDLHGEYPASLKQLTHPELCELIARLDPHPEGLSESGAVDWSDLPERLHYIIELFRLYQEEEFLFEPPFLPVQITAMLAGEVPAGQL